MTTIKIQYYPLSLALCLSLTGFSVNASRCLAATGSQQAYQLYQAHRFKEAAEAFDQYLIKNAADANALYYDALCNQQLGNMSRAKVLYKQVVQVSPGSQVATYSESILVKLDPSYHPSARGGTQQDTQARSRSAAASSDATVNPVQGPDSANVYYRPNGKRIMVTVEIDGHPVEMMLDTGAPGVCIGRHELESLGLRPPSGEPTGVTGGSSNSKMIDYWDLKTKVKVGPFLNPTCDLTIMDSEDGHALLGQAFIKYFEYQVDQSAHCIKFTKKGSKSASQAQGYTIPFVFREGGNRIIVDGEINGRKSKFMMDTGNTGSGIVFHSPEQAAKYGAPVPDGARVEVFNGVSGSGTAYVYTISHLRIGPIDCNDLQVAASMRGDVVSEEPLLGHEVFGGWQYTVDYEKHLIRLLRR